MSVEKRVAALLDLADAGGNRYAAYHVQQALEKLAKAVLLKRGIEAGVEHRLDELVKRFPDGDAWIANLSPLAGYTVYATTFRYPTPGGRIPSEPGADVLRQDLARVRTLLAAARTELLGG